MERLQAPTCIHSCAQHLFAGHVPHVHERDGRWQAPEQLEHSITVLTPSLQLLLSLRPPEQNAPLIERLVRAAHSCFESRRGTEFYSQYADCRARICLIELLVVVDGLGLLDSCRRCLHFGYFDLLVVGRILFVAGYLVRFLGETRFDGLLRWLDTMRSK